MAEAAAPACARTNTAQWMAGRVSITESTYRTLAERVLSGELRPGARIDANEIASADGVSPTPVRNALNRLVGAGLLVSRSNEGFFVPLCTEQDLRETYDASSVLLGLAISGAADARKRSKAPIPNNSKTKDGVVAETEAVFRTIMGFCSNTRLQHMFDDVNIRLRPARNIERGLIGNKSAEIRKIGSACQALDFEELERLIAAYHRKRLRCVARIVSLMNRRDCAAANATSAEKISK